MNYKGLITYQESLEKGNIKPPSERQLQVSAVLCEKKPRIELGFVHAVIGREWQTRKYKSTVDLGDSHTVEVT